MKTEYSLNSFFVLICYLNMGHLWRSFFFTLYDYLSSKRFVAAWSDDAVIDSCSILNTGIVLWLLSDPSPGSYTKIFYSCRLLIFLAFLHALCLPSLTSTALRKEVQWDQAIQGGRGMTSSRNPSLAGGSLGVENRGM